MVRGRAGVSVEAPLSLNSNKHPNWRASFGSQSMESPMVKISHGHSGDFLGGGRGAEQATTAIGRAPLGRIRITYSRKEISGLPGDGYGSHKEPPNFETDPAHGSSTEMRRSTLL